jgi:ribosomal protein S21
MAILIRKKEGESANSLVYRFVKKVQQGGVLRESKKRRFSSRQPNTTSVKKSRLYKIKRTAEIERSRKLGAF